MISRRHLLVTGGGVLAAGVAGGVLVETRVVPGRGPLNRTLGLTGSDGVVPDVTPGRVLTGSFASAARRTDVGWSLVLPPGAPADGLPVVVLLHGRGADHRFPVDALGVDRYLAAAVAAGAAPFALAAVDGGPDSYWHRRTSGEDPQRMLISEFVPLLARQGLRTTRIGLLGWSMGGYGALLLGALLGADRVAGVVASSPALWRHFDDTADGAFDNSGDFTANTVFTRTDRLAQLDLRIDCGRDDPFAPAVEHLRDQLHPTPAGGLQPGEHTAGYWRRLLPSQLAFLADRMT